MESVKCRNFVMFRNAGKMGHKFYGDFLQTLQNMNFFSKYYHISAFGGLNWHLFLRRIRPFESSPLEFLESRKIQFLQGKFTRDLAQTKRLRRQRHFFFFGVKTKLQFCIRSKIFLSYNPQNCIVSMPTLENHRFNKNIFAFSPLFLKILFKNRSVT